MTWEPNEGERAAAVAPPHPTAPVVPGTPAPGTRIGPFEVLRPLGHGGHAVLVVVRHVETGVMRALKVLRSSAADEAQRLRFHREFRALSRLNHANLLRVDAWGEHEGRPWFTMDVVDGDDLRVAASAWTSLEPDERFSRVTGVLVQIARALAAVHARGLVHRDVSPGNVLVDRDGCVKLADFGLVADGAASLTTDGEILGTLAHTAPEQLEGAPVDARADLYALGTVLYLMLTGRRPFQAHTVQGWVEQHLYGEVRPPRDVDERVPELLDRVCLRLLRKEPASRFASATHLLQVLGDLPPPPDPDAWPPREVGRGALLARLDEALDDVVSGRRGSAHVLAGPSGIGKTRLLDLLVAEASRRGVPVARGVCQPHDPAFGPFAALYAVLRGDARDDVLDRAFDPEAPSAPGRWAVLDAFRDLVRSRAPCVLVLDEIHRAEPATRQLLEHVVRNTVALGSDPVLVVVASDAELGPEPGIPPLPEPAETHTLQPLGVADVEELVGAWVRDAAVGARLARKLHAETDGRPAWIADALRALRDRGLVDVETGLLAVEPESVDVPSLALSASARDAVRVRVAGLSNAARAVGQVLALARGALDLDVVVSAAGLPEPDVLAGLDMLLAAGLATDRHEGDRELVELAHARFREALLGGLDPDRLAAGHRAVGEALEQHRRFAVATVAEALAHHFDAGRVPAKAYAYLAHTALARMRSGLFDEALGLIDRALAKEPEARAFLPLREADRQQVDLRIARCRSLYHLGRWDEAEREGRAALALAEHVRRPEQLARVRTRLGYVLRSRGGLDEAEALLLHALADAEVAGEAALRPRPLYHLGAIAWSRGRRDDAERCWRETLEVARTTGERRAEGMAHNGLGIVAASAGELAEARRLWEVAADLFREVGMVDYLVIAQLNLVELLIGRGVLHRAGQVIERALARAREVDHRPGIALALLWRARWRLALGDAREAHDLAAEAARIANAVGSADEAVHAGLVRCAAALEIGRTEGLAGEIGALVAAVPAADTDGLALLGTALAARAEAATGNAAGARERLAGVGDPAASIGFPHVAARVDLDLARAEEAAGRPAEASTRALRVLAASTARGQRLDLLVAHDLLGRVAPEAAAREQHVRQARALARSLAATLPRAAAEAFLAQRWGAGG